MLKKIVWPFTLSSAHCPQPAVRYWPTAISDFRSPLTGAIAAFTGLFACAALVFAGRRFFGALVDPLSPALLVVSGLLAGISALGIRTVRRSSFYVKTSSRGDLILDVLLGASLLIYAASLSLPGTNAWGLGFFWLFIAAEEIWAWRARAARWLRRSWTNKGAIQPVRVDTAESVSPHIEPVDTSRAVVGELLTPSAWPANDVTQQLTRSTSAEGSDVLSGWLRLGFAAGQRMGNLHVAFCPPFASTPELTVSQLDGPQARIKIAQLLPYGARLDLKLIAFNEESVDVLVQFSARAAGTNTNHAN